MSTSENSQNLTSQRGMVNEERLSKKERRIRKAVMLYYGEDLTEAEVAERIGVARRTVSEYLTSDTAKGFERIFTDQDRYEVQRWIESQLSESYQKALEGLQNAKNRAENNPEASAQQITNASIGFMRTQKQMVSVLQEIGVIQKPKERKEVEQKGSETEERFAEALQSAYQELENEESEKSEEALTQ